MVRQFALSIALVACVSADVFGMKNLHEMTPGNLGRRFNLSKSENADGTWFFIVTRNTPPALSRHAALSIIDESGKVLAKMELAPMETKDGGLKFCFSISKSLAEYSHLEVSENPRHSGAIQEVGGGDIFSFALIDFIKNASGIERFIRRNNIDIELLKAPNENRVDDEPSDETKSPSSD